jgi:hypothetical protein
MVFRMTGEQCRTTQLCPTEPALVFCFHVMLGDGFRIRIEGCEIGMIFKQLENGVVRACRIGSLYGQPDQRFGLLGPGRCFDAQNQPTT